MGWFKLNMDASVIDHKASGGGLIHDSEGQWVQGFARHIGTAFVLMAELWALRDGIHMARHLNIGNLIIKCVDSVEAIKLLSSPSNSNRLTQPLVNDCRILSKLSSKSVSFTATRMLPAQLILLQKLGVLNRSFLFLL